jgi:pimeloyl-ACP methyl ester carboxylesterase
MTPGHPVPRGMETTIVLVHGAFAESASWNGVIPPLTHSHHRVIAVANPLRGLAADAAAVSDIVREIDGPVVLVGHSYGGSVITNVDRDAGDIVSLVYVAGFAPEPGETCFGLSTKFPGSTLGDALDAWPRSDGTTDLTIAQEKFHAQFAADVPKQEAALMAATQRPVTREALLEPSGERPLWKELPSWFVFGALDRNIPAEVQLYMAGRAGAQHTSDLAGASHAVAVSRPNAVADVIREAAALRAAA